MIFPIVRVVEQLNQDKTDIPADLDLTDSPIIVPASEKFAGKTSHCE